MVRLLLIDDDPALIPGQVKQAFPAPAHHVEVAMTGAAGLARVAAAKPDVILLDQGLPDNSGLNVFQRIREIDARIPVIFITMAKGADTAIEAMKSGAYDYLFKPLDLGQLRTVVANAYEVGERMRKPAVVIDSADETETPGAIIGGCQAMREVYKSIGRVADQDVTVLITGESGTGKELAARAIYQHSNRANGLFLALNCAAIPENLLESELFGHEKGAFTGADRRRIGKFEQCNGGTLFLDEIGDMSLTLQAKMLRLLQEQSFERVGGSETIRTNVRLIAATHHDLKQDSVAGKFRSDLFYRLSVFSIHLPPLRERGDDIAVLIKHYLRRYSRELGREVSEISAEALDRIRAWSWPGNIRELQSVLKQTLLQAHGSVLLPSFLTTLPSSTPPASAMPSESSSAVPNADILRAFLPENETDLYAYAHQQLDRMLLPHILNETGGNQHETARRLGIARETLRRRMRELGMQVTRRLSSDDDE
jgi:DNA-binding NtrC family response regulator